MRAAGGRESWGAGRRPGRGAVIREAVVATVNPDASIHLTPLGYREEAGHLLLAPFVPSQTLYNLRARGFGALSFTDDVRVIAGCLTGRRDWPLVPCVFVRCGRLADALAHTEFEVVSIVEDAVRPEFICCRVHTENHAPFPGFNRAQAAIIEAAILVSRLDRLEPAHVRREFARLLPAVEKTAGERERLAWQWLNEAMRAHPRHGLTAAHA